MTKTLDAGLKVTTISPIWLMKPSHVRGIFSLFNSIVQFTFLSEIGDGVKSEEDGRLFRSRDVQLGYRLVDCYRVEKMCKIIAEKVGIIRKFKMIQKKTQN